MFAISNICTWLGTWYFSTYGAILFPVLHCWLGTKILCLNQKLLKNQNWSDFFIVFDNIWVWIRDLPIANSHNLIGAFHIIRAILRGNFHIIRPIFSQIFTFSGFWWCVELYKSGNKVRLLPNLYKKIKPTKSCVFWWFPLFSVFIFLCRNSWKCFPAPHP